MLPKGFIENARPVVLSRKNYNKIFCIGFNKTGTTTIELVLRHYGFNLPDQEEQEIRLTQASFATDYTELCNFVRNYDAFQDLPFSQGEIYVVADALFPCSKFILTERNPEEWFRSLCAYHQKMFALGDLALVTEQDLIEKCDYIYKGYVRDYKRRFLTSFYGGVEFTDWSKLYNKEYYIGMYEQRINCIRRYFAHAPHKLLVIDVTKENTTQKICDFLNIPQEFVIDMPHENKT